jgi:hypothetical protein
VKGSAIPRFALPAKEDKEAHAKDKSIRLAMMCLYLVKMFVGFG